MLRCTWTHVFVFSNDDDDDENNDSQKWLEVVRVGGLFVVLVEKINKQTKQSSIKNVVLWFPLVHKKIDESVG